MKLLATDLDGTLLYPNRHKTCMPKKNAKFVHDWIEKGNKVVCISSRSLSFKKKLEDEINDPIDFIGASSAQIEIDGKLIRNEHIPTEPLVEILNDIYDRYKPFVFVAVTEDYPFVIFCPDAKSKILASFYRLYWKFQGKKGEQYILDETTFRSEVRNGKVYKVILFFGLSKKCQKVASQITSELRKKYHNMEINWSKMVVELTPSGCDKATGLHKYCEYLNFPKENVYVIGDSGNDIAMFKDFYEHSYCLKHGYPSVKKYAKHIIHRVYDLDELVLKGA